MLDDVAGVMMRSSLVVADDTMRWIVLLNYKAVRENCNAIQLLKPKFNLNKTTKL